MVERDLNAAAYGKEVGITDDIGLPMTSMGIMNRALAYGWGCGLIAIIASAVVTGRMEARVVATTAAVVAALSMPAIALAPSSTLQWSP